MKRAIPLCLLLGLAVILAAMPRPVEGEGPQVAFPVGHSDPSDTGVRRGPAGAGGPIAGLSAAETIFFNEGLARFVEKDSVSVLI